MCQSIHLPGSCSKDGGGGSYESRLLGSYEVLLLDSYEEVLAFDSYEAGGVYEWVGAGASSKL